MERAADSKPPLRPSQRSLRSPRLSAVKFSLHLRSSSRGCRITQNGKLFFFVFLTLICANQRLSRMTTSAKHHYSFQAWLEAAKT